MFSAAHAVCGNIGWRTPREDRRQFSALLAACPHSVRQDAEEAETMSVYKKVKKE